MFKENAEGWRITGDAQGGYTEASYSPDGGVQDGYIYADDNVQGGVWYFTAPETYHGDKNEFYGAKLSFSLFQDSDMSNQFENSDIIFKNGDTQITYVYSPDAYPGEDWTDYSVTISAGNGWLIGEYDSEVEATEADIKAVLANVTEFSIRGEFESGPDNGGLDNIIIDK
ncbi:laminin B domain-containing protein [Marixanthomonas spongiae]|nr:laminin B domain-containing protein [Marixanthomonas spongiae]